MKQVNSNHTWEFTHSFLQQRNNYMERMNYQSSEVINNTLLMLNQALAAYLESIVMNLEKKAYPRTIKSFFSKEYNLEDRFIKSVSFFKIKKYWNIQDGIEDAYGIDVYYRDNVPENMFGYKDEDGELLITHYKVNSLFRFSQSGDYNFNQLVYQMSPYGGWRNWKMINRLNNDEQRDYVITFPKKLSRSEWDEYYFNNRWYELIDYVLTKLSQNYPRKFPDFKKFELEFYRKQLVSEK